MLPAIPRDQQLALLRKMLLIRRTEEHCICFHEGLAAAAVQKPTVRTRQVPYEPKDLVVVFLSL